MNAAGTPARPPSSGSGSHRRGWVSVVLIVSLCVNFFFVGTLAAWMIFKEPGGRNWGRGPMDLRRAMRTISEESRKKVWVVWRAHGPELRQRHRAFRRSRRELRDILVDPRSTEASRNDAFETMRKQGDAVQAKLKDIMNALSAALPAEERAKFFRSALRRHRHWRRERERGRDRDLDRRGPPPWRDGPHRDVPDRDRPDHD
jgi:uncharacterized membrane protein